MHDHFANEAERDRLDAQHREQHREQQQRAIAEWVAEEALNEHHGERDPASAGEQGADEAEEPQRFLGEAKKKVQAEDVDQPPNVHSGPIDSPRKIAGVLRACDLHHIVPVVNGEQGKKAREVAVERNILEHGASSRAHAARDIVQRAIREPTRGEMEREVLKAIHLRVEPWPAPRHREVGSAVDRREKLAQRRRLYLAVRRHRHDEIAARLGQGPAKQRGFADAPRRLDHTHARALPLQRV